MFNNIGEKIKKVASVATIVGIVISCVVGLLILIVIKQPVPAILVAGVGSAVSWLSMLTLYGFGHLIVQVDTLVEIGESKQKDNPDKHSHLKSNNTDNSTPLNTLSYNDNSNSTHKAPATMESCRKCGRYYDVGSTKCPYCGNKI